MKPAWRYLAIGAAAYLFILAVGVPAEFLRNTLQDNLPGLRLGAVSGSVFSGSASSAVYNKLQLGKLDWRFRPLGLLALRLDYTLTFSHPDHSGELRLGMRPGGSVRGRDLRVNINADSLVNRFSPMQVQTRGALSLSMESFRFENNQLGEVTGTADWQEAAIASPIELPLGNLAMTINSQQADLLAEVSEGGELGLSGNIRLQPGGRYNVDIVMQPGSGVSEDTLSLLDTMMQRNPAGGYRIRTAGVLR